MEATSLTLASLFPLKSNCDLIFLSQLCFWIFSGMWGRFYLVYPLFLLQLAADPWQESIPFGILTYLKRSSPCFTWVLVDVYLVLVFLWCSLSLYHFIFQCGPSDTDVENLNPFSFEGEHLADEDSQCLDLLSLSQVSFLSLWQTEQRSLGELW